jgi:hypothetical protein
MGLPGLAQIRVQTTIKLSPAVQASLTKTGNIKPGAITHLAAIRNVVMSSGQAAHLKSGAMKKFLTSLTGDRRPRAGVIAAAEEAADEFGIQHVSYTVPGATGVMRLKNLQNAELRCLREPKFQEMGNRIVVTDGDFFLTANHDLVLELPYGAMTIKKNTTVDVYCDDQGGRVINVSDNARDSVILKVCKKTIALMPGKECTFSLSKDYVMAKHHDGCGRRAVREDACCRYSFKVNEISIAALLKHDPIGRQVYHSTREQDIHLKKQMLKTAAALAFWTKSKTPYSWD